MARKRDVTSFDSRAESYDSGRLGRWHDLIVARCADLAMTSAPVPLRVLDVGCGTGALLEEFTIRLPTALEIVGVDPSRPMLERAISRLDGRAEVLQAGAEALPFADGRFDLVVCTLSFDHWKDRQEGMREVRRVMRADGILVLADLCGWWLINRRGTARHRRNIVKLARQADLEVDRRETIYRLAGLPLVQAFVLTG
jgi:ubiquinone/menaquinone biosynthesis C-methylase UbiE